MKIMKNKMESRANAALDSKWTGLCLAVVGLLMMAFGIFRGEMAVVFTKAIICSPDIQDCLLLSPV